MVNKDRQVVLNIRNLKCAYSGGKPVLEINALSIPINMLVFIIGRSGIGKSTFIETLGLMNKTMVEHKDTEVSFYPAASEEEVIALQDCWNLSNSELSALRQKNFSFIFQQTNLMPNFTAGENMMVSGLIENQSISEAKNSVLEVMDQLSLDKDLFDRKISHLSGGQRQRLAFVRAITADFTILFGDEPTGNLDRNTAEELMGILKSQIMKMNKTGIIVSHDLSLALKFADIIIPITSKVEANGDMRGEVMPENIIYQQEECWHDEHNNLISDPLQLLSTYLLS